ncbi:MAG: VCBS repeat-containing protein [Thermoplasmata archaeon]|nr:VCBS repeat-containing protein [Thermoplasmata archaeon]
MRKLKTAGLLFASLLGISIFLSSSPLASGLPSVGDVFLVLEAPGMGDIIVEDFNSDGFDDIAVASYAQSSVFVYFRTPIGMSTYPTVTIHANLPSKITSGDVNRDEKPDLVVLSNDRISVFEWQPGDQFELKTTLFIFDPKDVAVADSGSDGLNDIYVTGPFGTIIFFQDPMIPGRFDPARKMDIQIAWGDSLSLAGLDGDNLVDFIVTSSYHLTSFVQMSPDRYEISSTFILDRMDYNPEYTCVGDVNSDGQVDIVMSSPSYQSGDSGALTVFFSDASGEFSLSDSIEVIGNISTTALADFEKDGTSEILVSLSDGNLDVVSQSSGFTLNPTPLITMTEPEGMRLLGAGDFNDASLEDVVMRVAGFIYIFFLEDKDTAVKLVMPIPSTFHLNEGETIDQLIDLRQYFIDDHGVVSYALTYEEDSSKLDATLDGHFLSFDASPGWSGSMMFQVEAWDGNPNNEPTKSNVFGVWVNDAPKIVSIAPSEAEIGGDYSYQIIAEDDYPQWDSITYKLVIGSDGMSINEDGLLTWTPTDSGTMTVRIEARDIFGLTDVQDFVVEVPALPLPPPVVPDETPYVAGAAVTVISAVGIGALISENVKLALFMLIVPLYTKIRRERVLDHFVRGQIYGYILANPGEHYNAIKLALGLTNGSLAHHLRTLEREEFVKSRKFGLYRRFYPKHMRIPEDGGFRMNNIRKNIVDVIGENPGISQKEIATAINITAPTVNYHIGILASTKMIRVVREGRRTNCFVERS